MGKLRENLLRVEERIEAAKRRAGRSDAVGIVAVTKTHPAAVVEAALSVGLGRIGENRVQELEQKVELVGRVRAEWHLIGHLQRNKVRRALPLFDLIHSIDSLRLARELSAEAERVGRDVVGLVQVNASGEATKHGFGVEEAVDAVAEIVELPRLRVCGLMTMAPYTADEATLRRTFARTRALFDRCAAEVAGFEPVHLSMGMSNDFEIAVEEGATLVRLGTVLFGEREP
ncbi:MAG TPA: YggS family pyridoxal phosphate-dependent enzyme [Longimicrobiales bacterium]